MPKVIIYTTPFCSYCIAAKTLLTGKEVAYDEIDVSGDHSLRAEMSQKAFGRTSVPQIWIGDEHIGGFNELYGLDREGKLDALLNVVDNE